MRKVFKCQPQIVSLKQWIIYKISISGFTRLIRYTKIIQHKVKNMINENTFCHINVGPFTVKWLELEGQCPARTIREDKNISLKY